MALKPKIIKKGDAKPKDKPRRQMLLDKRSRLLIRVREIDKELQSA